MLFLARDRDGIKPLYVARQGGTFSFGSEQKAILAWPGFQRRVLRAFRTCSLLGADAAAGMPTGATNGVTSVDASVRIEGQDREGLERLVRYCSRCPLALERLHAPAGLASLERPEARLIYRLPESDL